MDNSPADQLPEADSLPDGFVESSVEPLIHRTAVLEMEEPSSNYKDMLVGLDRSNDLSDESSGSLMVKDSMVNERSDGDHRVEKAEKTRTFPVLLSEKGAFDGYENSLEVTDNECLDHRQNELVTSESDVNRSEAAIGLSLYNEVTTGSSDEHQHIEGDCQSSTKSSEGCLDLQTPNLNEGSPPESAECLKNRKLENSSEVKRKNVKRGLKSEKELLELTLKYQQVITERDAAIAVRDKLESLCRELQRQNKLLMDECKRVSTEGQNMRLDLSTKFHDAIKDVSNKLEVQKDDCLSQLKENEMLRNKLKHLTDQYALSEQQFTQKLKQKVLELQLADLKIQQHQEKYAQEQSQMQLYAEQVSQLLATEKNLRLQLAADGEKFQQFQDALLKSNEVFETFKQEMEKENFTILRWTYITILLCRKFEKIDG